MQKLALALVMILVSPNALAEHRSAKADGLAAILEKARFDQAIPVLEACRREAAPAQVIACADVEAGIFRNQGNGREWATRMLFLREAARAAQETANPVPSNDFSGVDFQHIAGLPPYVFKRPDGHLVIPTLNAEAAAGTTWSRTPRKAYLVRIETGTGYSVAMVDTGAPFALSMSGRTAEKLGITRVVATVPALRTLVSSEVPDHSEELRLAENVRIGPVEISNVLVRVDPMDRQEGAILGMGFIAKFRSIGFTENEIILDQPRPAGAKAVPYQFPIASSLGASVVLFNATTHGAARPAMFDTGLTSLLAFTNPLAEAMVADAAVVFMPHAEEDDFPPHKISQQSVSFNGFSLTDIPTIVFWKAPRSLPFEVMLGGEIQKILNVQLNFDDGNLYFWPRSEDMRRIACAMPPQSDASLKDDHMLCE